MSKKEIIYTKRNERNKRLRTSLIAKSFVVTILIIGLLVAVMSTLPPAKAMPRCQVTQDCSYPSDRCFDTDRCAFNPEDSHQCIDMSKSFPPSCK